MAISVNQKIVSFIEGTPSLRFTILLEDGTILGWDRDITGGKIGNYYNPAGMTLGEFILKYGPLVWHGIDGEVFGFEIKGSTKLKNKVWLEDLDWEGYETQYRKGRGYSGGHVSQSGFNTSCPEPIVGWVNFDQTTEGRYGGYYPAMFSVKPKQ